MIHVGFHINILLAYPGVYSFQYGLVCGEFMICSQALSMPSVVPHGPEPPERAVSCVESVCGKGS